MPTVPPHVLTDLRSRIARIARDPARRRAPAIRFGIAALRSEERRVGKECA